MSDDLFAAMPARPAAIPPVNTIEQSYDEVPYESMPFPQTHPSRLFTLGTLFGVRPTPVQRCRVLEIACAAGGNIIPAADYLPDSEFVGIDLSGKQIEEGQRLITELGLKNITLKKADILDLDTSYGTFDYIIAHGVFSWVPANVREKILDFCSKQLSPNGIAYISYNTYPGWHMRGMIRDMMRYHSGRFSKPKERIQQARALLDFMATSVAQQGPYALLLKAELENIRTQQDHYLFHEHLEEVNEPMYFHQFAEMAGTMGLQYLGEARLGTMVTGNFGPEIEKTLRVLATDQIQAEQYMDFLRNRMFRETLLCRSTLTPNWSVNPDLIRGLHIASGARPVPAEGQSEINMNDESPVTFRTPGGMTLTTNRALLKNAVLVLLENFPATMTFEQLRKQARERLGGATNENPLQPSEDAKLLAMGLLNCYLTSDMIELHGVPITFARTPGEKPMAIPLARLMAQRSPFLANRRHEVVRLSEMDRYLIPMLDGTADRPQLVRQLTELAVSGQLQVRRQDDLLTDRGDIGEALTSVIDAALNNIGRMAILTQ
jgi:methyltransferase-like protein/cyclopropane fatty-acyl-phospholipid synthase-like methyltransferase